MHWFRENLYVVTAPDAAANAVGRGLNMRLRAWESILAETQSQMTRYRLRYMDLMLFSAAGAPLQGILARFFVHQDLESNTYTCRLPLYRGTQGNGDFPCWLGDVPMGAGVVWNVMHGGLAAGDLCTCNVGYE